MLAIAAWLFLCAPLRAEPPPLNINFVPQRSAAFYLSSGMHPASPIGQAFMLHVGETLGFWDFAAPQLPPAVRSPSGAATVALAPTLGPASAFQALALLQAGDNHDCWSLEESLFFRPLEVALLAQLRDSTPLPAPDAKTPAAEAETFLLQDALVKALRAPPDAFSRASRSNVALEEVEKAPSRHRGLVLQLYGSPKLVRVLDAPQRLKDVGAAKFYEIWMTVRVGEVPRPVRLWTPHPPRGLKPGEPPPEALEIAATGYFLKFVRIEEDEGIPGQPERLVPLLIGSMEPVTSYTTRVARAAVTVVAAASEPRGLFGMPFVLAGGERANCWTIEDETQPPPLDRTYLASVRDDANQLRDVIENESDQRQFMAYTDAVLKAHRTKSDLFLKHVRADVKYVNLIKEPKIHRGQVVYVEGYLRQITKWEPNQTEAQNGIKAVYEVFLVVAQGNDFHPAVMHCTQLPPGFPESVESMSGQVKVAFVGYFFRKYRYKAKNNEQHSVPHMVGHVIDLRKPKDRKAEEKAAAPAEPPAEKPEDKVKKWLLPGFFIVLGGTLVIIVAMIVSYRRADRRNEARVQSALSTLVLPPEPDEPAEDQSAAVVRREMEPPAN